MGEGNDVDIADVEAPLAQAGGDGLVRETLGVHVAVEPLLLHERHHQTVDQEACRGVVAEAVDT